MPQWAGTQVPPGSGGVGAFPPAQGAADGSPDGCPRGEWGSGYDARPSTAGGPSLGLGVGDGSSPAAGRGA
eukprot:5330028-Alexandrium_andersonii.AAC.1